ncbi:MAG: formate-dependent phosphoribosylglycinamide formyltransferase [Mycobacterium sp.]
MTDGSGGPVGQGRTAERNEEHDRRDESTNPAARRRDDGHRIKVMLLGSDELARELTIAFQRLGAEVIAVEAHADAPAHGVADQSLVVKMTAADELMAEIGRIRPDYVVPLSEAVAADALTAVAETQSARVVPSARGARLSNDLEGLRRLAADGLGLPTAPFWFAGSLDELKAVTAHAGFPLVVKPLKAGGQGQSRVSKPDEVEPAWQRAVSAGSALTHNRVLAETAVEVDVHVTLLAVASEGSAGMRIEFCAPIGHSEPGGDVLECWQPQQLSPAALDSAKSIAARIVKALGGRGFFAVDLMVAGDEVYFSDVTARPLESGLVTLRTQRLSQFELQARVTLGLTVDTVMISPGAAQVIHAGHDAIAAADHAEPHTSAALADALAVPESDIRVFSSRGTESRRRFGAALATAPDISTARDRSRQVAAVLRRLPQP